MICVSFSECSYPRYNCKFTQEAILSEEIKRSQHPERKLNADGELSDLSRESRSLNGTYASFLKHPFRGIQNGEDRA